MRPTVYRYAREYLLSGWVKNTEQGVIIEVEGLPQNISAFIDRLRVEPPPHAQIDSVQISDMPIQGKQEEKFGNEFKIDLSQNNQSTPKSVEISPDIATCNLCLQEIFDTKNRRFGYPFTNCTNCGPRFTIIQDRPYDRKFTSMSTFPMCDQCLLEYNNPLDRRFHAQPNACNKCGPHLYLLTPNGMTKSEYDLNPNDLAICATTSALNNGAVVAIKGLGGFNLAANPFMSSALARLRTIKKRPHQGFALMMKNLEVVKKYCHLNVEEETLLMAREAPIVLLRRRMSITNNHQLEAISPDNNYLGVMLPYTPLHHLLFSNLYSLSCEALIMTSANLRDEPMAINDQQIVTLLKQRLADLALSHNRNIINRCDDSIMQIVNHRPLTIRRSRGYVPKAFTNVDITDTPVSPTITPTVLPDVSLALGANLKNCFALRKRNKIYLSPHIGDLDDYENYLYQEEQIQSLQKLLDLSPQSIIGDAHPGYQNYEIIQKPVFHHSAHLLSVVAEHSHAIMSNPNTPLLGVICDGTGYGEDGHSWGFEFLELRFPLQKQFQTQRRAHLRYFPLPGGDLAAREIDRIAISLLKHSGIKQYELVYGNALRNPLSYAQRDTQRDTQRITQILSMIEKKINSPLTSSLGRLFDGVAAIVLGIQNVEYEAQAAMRLQKIAESSQNTETSYEINFVNSDQNNHGPLVLDFAPMIRGIIDDIQNNCPLSLVAYKFHLWVARSIIKTIDIISNETTMPPKRPFTILLSGGCFQNTLLTTLVENMVTSTMSPMLLYRNQYSPINDAGIALGQALSL
ncbi:MAG: carbamoyltransferase HypF [Oligoflexia bacterium]|nr:carbamoyltransferase HypF [Oligoflexia bacterium]